MKKTGALLYVILTVVLLCCGCAQEEKINNEQIIIDNNEKIVGEWKEIDGSGSVTFFEGGTGDMIVTEGASEKDFTWEYKNDILYLHFEDTRETYIGTKPFSKTPYTITYGEAAHTNTYRLKTDSIPYKLEAIDAYWDYEKVES